MGLITSGVVQKVGTASTVVFPSYFRIGPSLTELKGRSKSTALAYPEFEWGAGQLEANRTLNINGLFDRRGMFAQ
jgi:hypothetical protein